ncbi:hypothetical protein FJY63_12175, partial [Candidatus Sumerlaeota bacterium]|nr:hypothetical protein [Candidatus Sumerlaeota bacterium]
TRVLAQPRILVKNREIGAFTDGGTMSYATTTYYGGGYGGYGQYNQGGYGGYVPSVAPGSIPTGVNLMVEPTVMNNGLIEIHVTLDNVSGTRNPTKLAGQDYDLVDTTNQNIDTTLVIPDGQTRMIGGMIENRETESTQGIPYLKDIPFIGPIVFGKKTQDPISRRTLLMFISPTVVQEETRKYATPPDESEMTPPTFYEQASWSAAAVKRAVEKAMKQAESEYGVSMPAAGAKVTEAPEAALAPVALEHGETTKTVGREKPTSPALPAAERQPTTKPVELTPLATPILPEPKPPATTSTPPQAEKRPAVKAASPTKQLGEKPPSPAAKVTTPTTTGKLSAKVAPQPIGRTVSDKSEVSRTSPSLERIAVPGAKLPDQTKKLELPTTGTVMLESGPPAVVLSSRRPGDLPLPRAPVLGPVGLVESKPAGSTSQPAEISSYEVTVIGPDGLPATAEPSGQWLQPVALGTLPIPAELLAPAGSAAAAALVAVPAGTAPPAAPRLGTILFGGAQGTAPVPVQPGVGAVRPPSAAPPPGYVARPATTPYGTATVASPYGAPVPARPALSARPTPYSPYARPPVPIPFR